jgi:REP element-mobilizing transposase RayT
MPASYCFIAMHIVFSTRDRRTWLRDEMGKEMHSYLAGIIKNLGGKPIIVNGIPDHVHVLCLAPKDISLVEFMTKIKANSSKWFRDKHKLDFHWQDGYSAYSVSKSNLESVQKYIKIQEEHHLHTSTQQEFDALLQKHLDTEE